MADFVQWVSKRAGPDVAFAFEPPPEINPFLETIWECEQLTDAPPITHIRIEPPFTGRFTDDFAVLNDHCILLSSPLVDFLRHAGVDSFETHHCRINAGPEKDHQGEYNLVIIRDIVFCFDWEKSIFCPNPENPRIIEFVESLAIDEVRAAGNLLFRLGEKRQIVIADASLADAIREGNFSGVDFAAVDGSAPLSASVDQVGGEWPDFVIDYCESNVEEDDDDD